MRIRRKPSLFHQVVHLYMRFGDAGRHTQSYVDYNRAKNLSEYNLK
jgi:hypothetical protein